MQDEQTQDEQTQVLIVGGGMVGLAAAVFSAWHGVRTLLVERHPEILVHPRARGINARSVELLRQVGLEERLFAARGEGIVASDEDSSRMLVADSLASADHSFVDLATGEAEGVSPCEWCPIDQDRLEGILRTRAEELGAEIRFHTEFEELTQDALGVTAVLRDRATGERRTVRAGHLVAADGQRSPVRESLGIPVEGPGVLLHTVSVVVEADLGKVLRGRRFGFAYLNRPEQGAVIFPHDGDKRWCFGTPYHPDRGETVDDYPEERCLDLFREATGDPTLTGRLIAQLPSDGTKVLPFVIGAQCAERFSEGRVFLAGDAARIVPPTGAFGGSAGIQDAHNLAWKIAAVVRGEAGSELLATYDAERRAVSEFTMEQAMAQMVGRTGNKAADVGGVRVHDWWSVVLGYRYRSAAVLSDEADGGDGAYGAEGADESPAIPPQLLCAQPGTRAPHLPLERDGAALSTLDLYGRHFVLVAGASGEAWREAAARSCTALDVPLDFHRIGGDLRDPAGRWAARHGVKEGGAVLVRPDGFVAWRAEDGDRAEERLTEALTRVLSTRPVDRAS
ncbi:FAD-dependent monooxygenase [Streptomyces sp. NPDC059063]|uniref:FAD-dependent monooxygenase n=1 Tax=unclassified Streptomyces TaxID=2593676 RepID=UPI00369367B3